MREKTIENYLVAQIKALGGIAYKFVSPGNAGVPDRLILLPGGRMCFAEVKAPGETASLLQRRVHGKLISMGFRVFMPDSKKAVDFMIRQLKEGATP